MPDRAHARFVAVAGLRDAAALLQSLAAGGAPDTLAPVLAAVSAARSAFVGGGPGPAAVLLIEEIVRHLGRPETDSTPPAPAPRAALRSALLAVVERAQAAPVPSPRLVLDTLAALDDLRLSRGAVGVSECPLFAIEFPDLPPPAAPSPRPAGDAGRTDIRPLHEDFQRGLSAWLRAPAMRDALRPSAGASGALAAAGLDGDQPWLWRLVAAVVSAVMAGRLQPTTGLVGLLCRAAELLRAAPRLEDLPVRAPTGMVRQLALRVGLAGLDGDAGAGAPLAATLAAAFSRPEAAAGPAPAGLRALDAVLRASAHTALRAARGGAPAPALGAGIARAADGLVLAGAARSRVDILRHWPHAGAGGQPPDDLDWAGLHRGLETARRALVVAATAAHTPAAPDPRRGDPDPVTAPQPAPAAATPAARRDALPARGDGHAPAAPDPRRGDPDPVVAPQPAPAAATLAASRDAPSAHGEAHMPAAPDPRRGDRDPVVAPQPAPAPAAATPAARRDALPARGDGHAPAALDPRRGDPDPVVAPQPAPAAATPAASRNAPPARGTAPRPRAPDLAALASRTRALSTDGPGDSAEPGPAANHELLENLAEVASAVGTGQSRVEAQLDSLRSGVGDLDATIRRIQDEMRRIQADAVPGAAAGDGDGARPGHPAPLAGFDEPRFEALRARLDRVSTGVSDLARIKGDMEVLADDTHALLRQQVREAELLQEGLAQSSAISVTAIATMVAQRLAERTGRSRVLEVSSGAECAVAASAVKGVVDALTMVLEQAAPPASGAADGSAHAATGGAIAIDVREQGSWLELAMPAVASAAAQLAQISAREIAPAFLLSAADAGRIVVRFPLGPRPLRVVVARTGDDRFALPAELVRGATFWTPSGEPGAAQRVATGGRVYEVVRLDEWTGRRRADPPARYQCLLLDLTDRAVAVAADHLAEPRMVTVAPLPPPLSRVPGVLGAVVTDGGAVPVLDPRAFATGAGPAG